VIPIAGGHAITALSLESTHRNSFRAVRIAHAAGAEAALSAVSASEVSAVSGSGTPGSDRSPAARVDTTRARRNVRRMHHPTRAATAAALTAVLVLASARDAAADAGGFALRRFLQPAGPTGSGAPPAPPPTTSEPTPEIAAWAGTPAPTSLPALLSTAIQQTPALLSAQIDIAIAEARYLQAQGINDWVIGADVRVSRGTTSLFGFTSSDLTVSGAADITRSLSTGGTIGLGVNTSYRRQRVGEDLTTEWSDSITLNATQPLLRGRGAAIARAELRRAKLARNTAVLGRRQSAIAAVQTVVAAYWDLALAERQLAIRRSGLELIAERRRLTEAGIKGGKVAPSELLAVDQAVATQQEQILSAEVGVVNQSIAVRRASGLKIEAGAILLASGADASAPARTASLDDALGQAFETSPELALLAVQDQDAVISVEVAENGLLPQLDAALSLGPSGRSNKPGEALTNTFKFDEFAIAGSLTFQYELGHRGATGATRAARLAREKIQVNATDIRAQIAQSVAQAVATLELAARRVALAQIAIDLARKNIEVEQARFSLGKSTNFDVLQRQNELQQAELSKAQAEIDARKAEASLSALTGDLLDEYGISLDAKAETSSR
jgi:outer membrane protein TolC